jgi:AcrR family transcriptional regulator
MRERILATATALFVARGYEGVAMREIAADCGITKAALYYHFDGKAEVLDAIVTGYLAEIGGVVAESAAHGTGEQRLRWLVEQLFALPSERRAIMRLAMHDAGQLPPESRAAFGRDYRDTFIAPLQAIVADASTTGEFKPLEPAVVVWLLLGMLYPFFGPPGTPAATGPEAVADLLDVFFHGVSATSDARRPPN